MEQYTKYEIARMVGARALQISMGAPFLLKLTAEQLQEINYNPITIARKELEQGVIPLTIVHS
ncbi:MAG: DNA-directed RNA polymerase subunit K [Candidatus Woesearchaeota archaeon]